MAKEEIREVILDTIEASLDAQLRAVRRLRGPQEKEVHPREGLSQIDMAYDVLRRAGKPLHISQILAAIEKTHGVRVDRESLVSALTKKVAKGDRFARTDKNTFGLLEKEA